MWDGEVLSGPVPTLFSEDVKRTEDGLRGKNTENNYTLKFLLRIYGNRLTVSYRLGRRKVTLNLWNVLLFIMIYLYDEFIACYNVLKELIIGNPDRAHADMLKLARNFFIAEHVTLEKASSLIKKPR